HEIGQLRLKSVLDYLSCLKVPEFFKLRHEIAGAEIGFNLVEVVAVNHPCIWITEVALNNRAQPLTKLELFHFLLADVQTHCTGFRFQKLFFEHIAPEVVALTINITAGIGI